LPTIIISPQAGWVTCGHDPKKRRQASKRPGDAGKDEQRAWVKNGASEKRLFAKVRRVFKRTPFKARDFGRRHKKTTRRKAGKGEDCRGSTITVKSRRKSRSDLRKKEKKRLEKKRRARVQPPLNGTRSTVKDILTRQEVKCDYRGGETRDRKQRKNESGGKIRPWEGKCRITSS